MQHHIPLMADNVSTCERSAASTWTKIIMGITTRLFSFSGKSIGGFLLVQAGSSLCSLRSAVRPSSFRGEGGHTPLAIFSYSEEGKVMLDVLKNERNDAS